MIKKWNYVFDWNVQFLFKNNFDLIILGWRKEDILKKASF
jgi:hypothetical protein